MSVKKLVQALINKMGYVLYKRSPFTDPGIQLVRALEKFEIDLILDVGANTGQFASDIRKTGFTGKIISFEPLSSAYELLKRNASKDKAWVIHPRCAIGDTEGKISINISGNSVSSSALPMLDAHLSAANESRYIGAEEAPLTTLDSVAQECINPSDSYFIKIDTQGFEWQVLNGASQVLSGAKGVLCEMSTVPLYQGQRLWWEVYERLLSSGFSLWAIQKGFTDPENGRTLQFDAIFFRC